MTAPADIRVLVVEDEPVAAAAHELYVGRVPGFRCIGVARDARSALRLLGMAGPAPREIPDLVLLDMHLPDRQGLDVVRAMRAAGHPADVIAVTSARDLDLVRASVSAGVVQYVLKPFAFATLREKLEGYAAYRAGLAGAQVPGQDDVDRALDSLRAPSSAEPAKGLNPTTLTAIANAVRSSGPLSAAEAGLAIGASRVTARRYLEHLADAGSVVRRSRFGGTGRPETEYNWR